MYLPKRETPLKFYNSGQSHGIYNHLYFTKRKERREEEKGKKKREKIDPAKIITHNHEGYLWIAINIHLGLTEIPSSSKIGGRDNNL